MFCTGKDVKYHIIAALALNIILIVSLGFIHNCSPTANLLDGLSCFVLLVATINNITLLLASAHIERLNRR